MGITLTVERTRLACFASHSVRSWLTFETVGISENCASSASWNSDNANKLLQYKKQQTICKTPHKEV